jgi:O-antigen/teichoic acid export membrane protein
MTLKAALDRSKQRVRAVATSQATLLGNAGALSSSTLVSAIMGFAYWVLAARCFTTEAVGYAAAAIAIVGLVGLFGEFGLGSLLVGEVQREHLRANPRDTSALIWAALWASMAGGAMIGLLAFVGASLAGLDLGTIAGGWPKALFFMAMCAATSFCLVLDQGLVGLLDAGRQMYRNTVFAVLKIVFLVALVPFSTGLGREFEIFATWMFAKVVSVQQVLPLHGRLGGRAWRTPSFAMLGRLQSSFLAHHALNIASQAPALMLPVMVTWLLGAKANAAFYTSWMLLTVALLVPAALTTVLFSVGVKEPRALPERLRFTLTLSAIASVGAVAGFALLGPRLIAIFGADYVDQMGASIRLFGFTLFGMSIKYHYIAVARINHQMLPATWLMLAGGILELMLCALGARAQGLYGLTVGFIVAVSLEALVMGWSVLRANRAWTAEQGWTS